MSTSNAEAERQLCDALRIEKQVTPSNVGVLLQDYIHEIRGFLGDAIDTAISFAGFDAVAMRKIILEKAATGQIVLCIIIGLVRGNNVQRILSTMKGGLVKKDFADCVRVLDLKPRVAGKHSVITLSRVIACYPEVAAAVASVETVPMAVPTSSLLTIHAEYPLCSRHQSCASLIPDTLPEDDVLKALDVILLPYLLMSETINSRDKLWLQKTKNERAQLSAGYLRNSYNSRVLSVEARMEECKRRNIVTTSGKLSSSWISVSVAATAWLKKKYSYSFTEEE